MAKKISQKVEDYYKNNQSLLKDVSLSVFTEDGGTLYSKNENDHVLGGVLAGAWQALVSIKEMVDTMDSSYKLSFGNASNGYTCNRISFQGKNLLLFFTYKDIHNLGKKKYEMQKFSIELQKYLEEGAEEANCETLLPNITDKEIDDLFAFSRS